MNNTESYQIMDLPALIISFLTILFTIIILTMFKILTRPSPQKSPPFPQKSPPGPQKLPLIGNLHQLAFKATVPHRRLAELARVYGPIMHLQVGEVPTVVISSADVAREAMMTQDAVFCNRPTLMLAKELFYDCTDIGLAPYGEYWRQVRKISTLELFTLKRVESFRRVREEETAHLVESIASRAGSVVNLSKKLFGLTFNITSRATFSKKGKDQEAFQALTTKVSEAASFSVADLYPSLEWLIPSISGIKRKLQKLVHESNKILDPIIEEHKGKRKVGNEKEDLVDVLLKFHKDNVSEEDEFSLTTNNIKAIILELFGAGSETSSSVIEWAMSEMIKNPRVMEKAQNEVREVHQLQGVVDEMKLDKLKYLELVIKETLRLHPPVPLLPPRESMNLCQLNDYEIPSKTRVLINVWAIGRDPKYWTEPESFVPERFEESSTDYKGTHFEYIPFGAGRRRCPGMALGIANVRLPLANLLYHFDWKLPSTIKQPEDLNMDESFGITMRRKNELLVIPSPYN